MSVRVSLADLRNRAEPRDRITLRSSEVLALVAAVEAAQAVVILEYDPARTSEQNAELRRRAEAFRAAFAPFIGQPEEDA